MIHPVFARSRREPNAAAGRDARSWLSITSTTAAAAFGFFAVLGLRELLHAILGTAGSGGFRWSSRAALVVALVTTLLLIPACHTQGRQPGWLMAPCRRVCCRRCGSSGMHDMMSGHIWAQAAAPGPAGIRSPCPSAHSKRCTRAAVPCCTSSDWRARAASWSCCSVRLPRTSGTIDGFPIPPVSRTAEHGP